LKARLKDHYIEYKAECVKNEIKLENGQKFIDQTIRHLKSVIESELAKVVNEDEIQQEVRYHKEFAESLIAYFTGREDALKRIWKYLDDKNTNHVLSLIGASGSGKTCVMAKAVLQAKGRKAVVVYRFIGANAKSCNIVSFLTSICGQIAQDYGANLDSLLDEVQKGQHLEINLLTELFLKCLALPKPDRPLVLFLDALDQLSEMDNARSLNWLPKDLPPHSRIIVSCLPELEGTLKEADVYHLPLMPKADGERLLDTWLNVQKRKLMDEQKKEVLGKFSKNGLPLFLKIAFEQARKWHSYSKTKSLPDNVPSIIEQFFSGLEEEHSHTLVSKAVGYILSGKDKGLTEDEILDMLVFDEEHWQYFLKHSHPSHRKEVEKAKKIPVAVWSRLFLDLAPYLTERDSYGERIIGFYHRQFNEILERYLKIDKAIHQKLASYFMTMSNFLDDRNRKKQNVRKCLEQPYQQTKAGMWDEVTETLCDLSFLEAKCAAGMTYILISDYSSVLQVLPERIDKNISDLQHMDALKQYCQELICFADGQISALPVFPSQPISGFNNRNSEATATSISQRFIRIQAFFHFVQSQASILDRMSAMTGFTAQHAYNCYHSGPMAVAAEKYINSFRDISILHAPFQRKTYDRFPAQLHVFEGHQGEVLSVSITPDGMLGLSACRQKDSLRLWDLFTGRCLLELIGQGHADCVDISADGTKAVAAANKQLFYMDMKAKACIHTFTAQNEGHFVDVKDVKILPNAKRAVAAGIDKLIRIFDLEKMKCIKIHEGIPESIISMEITPDGRMGIFATHSAGLYIWDLEKGVCIKILKEGRARYNINAVCITPNFKTAISANQDKTLRVWDLDSGTCLHVLQGHEDVVNTVHITPDGKRAVSGGYDTSLYIWDIESAKCLGKLSGHSSTISSVKITVDGLKAVSASHDGTVRVWNLSAVAFHTDKKSTSFPSKIKALARTDDGKQVVTGIEGRILSKNRFEIHVYDFDTGTKIRSLEGHTSHINTVRFTPNGKYVISGSGDHSIRIWNLEEMVCEKIIREHDNNIVDLKITPDNQNIISISEDKTMRVFNMGTWERINIFNLSTDRLQCLALSPDGKKAIVSGSKNWLLTRICAR